ncbi:MAG TPA: hypothetical protein DCO86_01115 [Spirochaetaceae bacterium]|nr:hypothetical protein [Spirochaetaceae bacterium]
MKKKWFSLLFLVALSILFSCQLSSSSEPYDLTGDDKGYESSLDNPDIDDFSGDALEGKADKAYVSGSTKEEGKSFVVSLSNVAAGYSFNELAESVFRKGVSLKSALAVKGYKYPDGIDDVVLVQDVAEGSTKMVLKALGSGVKSGATLNVPIQKKYVTKDADNISADFIASKAGGFVNTADEIKNISANVEFTETESDVATDVVYTGKTTINFVRPLNSVGSTSAVLQNVSFDLINTKLTAAGAEFFKTGSSEIVSSFASSSKYLSEAKLNQLIPTGRPDWVKISVVGEPKEGDTQLNLLLFGFPGDEDKYLFDLVLNKEWFDKGDSISASSLAVGFNFMNKTSFGEKASGDGDVEFMNIFPTIPGGMLFLSSDGDVRTGQTTVVNGMDTSILILKLVNHVFSQEAEKELTKGKDLASIGMVEGLPPWLNLRVCANDTKYGYKSIIIEPVVTDRNAAKSKYDANKTGIYTFIVKSKWLAKKNKDCSNCYDDIIVKCQIKGFDNSECEGCTDVIDDADDDQEHGGDSGSTSGEDGGGTGGSSGSQQENKGTGELVEITTSEEFNRLVKGNNSGIVVFEASKPGCGYCEATRTWLDSLAKSVSDSGYSSPSAEDPYANISFYVAEALGSGDVNTSVFSDAVKVGAVEYNKSFGTPLILIYENGVPKYGVSQPRNGAAVKEFVDKAKELPTYAPGKVPSSSGSDSGSTGSGTSSTQPAPAPANDANGYFVRPRSGERISLPVSQDSDIWYIYTNTSGSNKQRPSTPSAGTYGNVKESGLQKFRANAEIMVDFAPAVLSGIQPFVPDLSKPSKGLASKGGLAPKADYGEQIRISNSLFLGTVTATRKYMGELIATKAESLGGSIGNKRRVYIYAANDGTQNRRDIDYNALGDALLKDGEDNDIFDRVVDLFGSDWGYFNQEYAQSIGNRTMMEYFIPKDENITIVIGNIAERTGAAGGYEGGTYWNTERNGVGRRILALDADCLAGNNIGSGLTTLAHEFQHLIHGQYFNENNQIIGKVAEKGNALQEIFSAMVENYLAEFISSKTGKAAADPFGVGANNGSMNSKGYVTSAFSKWNYSDYWRPMRNLASFSTLAFDSWTQSGTHEEYGNGNTLAYYLLVNYGLDVYREYMNIGLNENVADIECMVRAINKVANSNITKTDLIANMQTAAMLSKVSGLKPPFAFNNNGWFDINGCKVPSVNMWLYASYPDGQYGYVNSGSNMVNDTNNIVKVRQGVKKGETYSATAPSLPAGVMLTVVAVPSK